MLCLYPPARARGADFAFWMCLLFFPFLLFAAPFVWPDRLGLPAIVLAHFPVLIQIPHAWTMTASKPRAAAPLRL
jgi:hypothetical protein